MNRSAPSFPAYSSRLRLLKAFCAHMQILPPSVKSTASHTKSGSGKVSKRRLLSLIATAAIASGAGIAMGSTLRFQVVPASQSPLFKPQQDFPPLAQWPPEVPLADERDAFGSNWEEDLSSPQLVYNDLPDTNVEAIESYEATADIYGDGELEPDDLLTPTGFPSADSDGFGNEDNSVTDEVLDEEALPPLVSTSAESTSTEDLNDEPAVIDASQTTDNIPIAPAPWFNKQPLSESQFTDDPVIISPDVLSPAPDLLSD